MVVATAGCLQLELEDLRTFIEVANAGGLSAAARRLGVSKSIVSRRIFRLEEALGVQVLARTTRGVRLTESGLTFREHAFRACSEMDIALETILPAGELRGGMRIAAPFSFGSTHLAPVFAELARRHPRLHVQTSYSDRFVDVVAEGFDCAVRVGHLPRLEPPRSEGRIRPCQARGKPGVHPKAWGSRNARRSSQSRSPVTGARDMVGHGWSKDDHRPSPGPVQSGQRGCAGRRGHCRPRHRKAAGLSD